MQDIQLGELKNKVTDSVQQKFTAGIPGNNPGTADGTDQRGVHIGLSGDPASHDMVTDVAGPSTTATSTTAPAATEPSPYVPRGVPGQAGM